MSKKPRILVLTSTFPRWKDDTEPRFVLDLCRHLSAYTEILVLAPGTPGAQERETLEGVAVRRFRYFVRRWQAVAYEGGIVARLRQKPSRVLQLPFFLAALWWQTSKLIRTFRPDLIHAHWIVPQGLVACMVRGKVPILCTSHGGDLHALRGPFFTSLKAWILGRCSSITVVSHSMEPIVRVLAPEARIEVIPMGTDLDGRFTPPASERDRADNELVFAGRLVEKKGVDVLLAAFVQLRREMPGLNLTIVGDGPLRSKYMRIASDAGADGIRFAGSLNHRELAAIYRRATVAVFPFVVARDGDQEGFGLVAVEAMGCRCPVVASDLPAVRDSIRNGKTGILVPPGDVDALAEALQALLSDRSVRRQLADAALEHARRQFGWPAIAERYRELIEAASTCGGGSVR